MGKLKSNFKNKIGSFTDKSYKKNFINSCLTNPNSDIKEKINWAKEMKIMNTLCLKVQNPDFWLHCLPGFPIPSLAWFLTDDGRKFLNERYKRFNSKIETLDKICTSNLKHENFKEEENIVNENSGKKFMSLKDFLRKKI